MIKQIKYRIYPTEPQQIQLAGIFGSVRCIYNLGLETKIMAYNGSKTKLSCFDLIKQLTALKQDCLWLYDTPNECLQMSLRNVEKAFRNHFQYYKGFPKFKNKHSKQSFQLVVPVKFVNNKLKIPKLDPISIDLHRPIVGQIKTTTISKTTTNKYYASILVETGEPTPAKKPINEKTSTGIDLGLTHFAILSDGRKFENQGFLKSQLRQLKIEQRSLARKKKGSNRRESQRLRVALLHEKIRNRREDFLHKFSKKIVDEFATICVENLPVSNMVKNHKLAKSISDQGWSKLVHMIEYKSNWYGKNLIKIGRFEPSSKLCSNCGFKMDSMDLSIREWRCPACGSMHDRDINAAKNIKQIGLGYKPSVTQSGEVSCACNVQVI